MLDVGKIFNQIKQMQGFQGLMDSISLAQSSGSVKRSDVQREITNAAKKENMSKEASQELNLKDKTNKDKRMHVLVNEGLGHISRTAKLTVMSKRIAAIGKYKTIDDAITALESTTNAGEKDGSVTTYRSRFGSKTFEEVSQEMLSGVDSRRISELITVHDDQTKRLQQKLVAPGVEKDSTVIEHMADLDLLQKLKSMKQAGLDISTASKKLSNEAKHELKDINRRTIVVSARLCGISK